MSSEHVTPDKECLKALQIAKDLWKITYALAGFVELRDCIQNSVEVNFSKESPQYYPLLVGLICLYARPFTDNNIVGCISSNLVPEDDRPLHKMLMDLRNEVYGHNDPASLIRPGDYAHEIIFRQQGLTVMIIPQRFHNDLEFLPKFLLGLAETMVRKTEDERQRLQELLKPYMPRERGDYRLNVVDFTRDLFLPIDSIEGTGTEQS
jgi:hypothetical protein